MMAFKVGDRVRVKGKLEKDIWTGEVIEVLPIAEYYIVAFKTYRAGIPYMEDQLEAAA